MMLKPKKSILMLLLKRDISRWHLNIIQLLKLSGEKSIDTSEKYIKRSHKKRWRRISSHSITKIATIISKIPRKHLFLRLKNVLLGVL